MATQKTGNGAAYPASTLIPDDGDTQPAASVNVAFEALLDRTEWLREAKGKPIRVELPAAQQAVGGGSYEWSLTNNRYGWLQTTPGPDPIYWYVTIPPNHKVISITAHVIGDDGPGTHVGLPQELPYIRIYRQPLTGGTFTLEAEQQDTSGDLPTYDAYHTIELLSLSLSFETDYCVIEWFGEDGIQAVSDAVKLIGIQIGLIYTP
jgi:hypothetical protein